MKERKKERKKERFLTRKLFNSNLQRKNDGNLNRKKACIKTK
jgi:hypothetical protein